MSSGAPQAIYTHIVPRSSEMLLISVAVVFVVVVFVIAVLAVVVLGVFADWPTPAFGEWGGWGIVVSFRT